MSEFEIGQEVFTVSFDIKREKIGGMDVVSGINKYFFQSTFGYYTKDDLFKTKNEAIDYLIKQLEARKDV